MWYLYHISLSLFTVAQLSLSLSPCVLTCVEQIDDFTDDYLIIDCPGQIELFSHLPVMKLLCKKFQNWGYRMCGVYLVDSLMVSDSNRFFAGVMMCLSAMIQLELPHVNLLSKVDLVQDKKLLARFMDPEVSYLLQDMNQETTGRMAQLNEAIASLISQYSMVSFLPFSAADTDSIENVLSHVDLAMQYGEDLEPREMRDEPEPSAEA